MQGEDPYGPVEEHAFRVVYGFYEGEELVRLKWYHPFASYLEERWYRSRGILEWYLERHQRFLKEGVARLWSAAIINRLSCIVGFLLNTVDDIVDTDHFHGPDLHFYERWRDEFSRMSPDEARSLDGGWTAARIRDCGPSLDGVLCWTALMYATSQGYTDIVEMLLNKNAQVDRLDSNGMTVLWVATHQGKLKLAEILLKAGADKHGKDKAELTPIHLAKQNSHHAAHDAMVNPNAGQKAAVNGPAPAKRKRPPKKKKGEAASPSGSASKKKKPAPFTAPPAPSPVAAPPASPFQMPNS